MDKSFDSARPDAQRFHQHQPQGYQPQDCQSSATAYFRRLASCTRALSDDAAPMAHGQTLTAVARFFQGVSRAPGIVQQSTFRKEVQ